MADDEPTRDELVAAIREALDEYENDEWPTWPQRFRELLARIDGDEPPSAPVHADME